MSPRRKSADVGQSILWIFWILRDAVEGRSHVIDDGIHSFGPYGYEIDTTGREPPEIARELVECWRTRTISVLFSETSPNA